MLSKPERDDMKSLVVNKQPIEVVANEDGIGPLSWVMPPLDDIAEINSLKGTHFSIKEHADSAFTPIREIFRQERLRLEGRAARYSGSTTFLNRLANLASFAGDLENEENHLRAARSASSDQFFSNRLVENLLNQDKKNEAIAELNKADFSKNIQANLRKASILVSRGQIDEATEYVQFAVKIDPLDYGARLFDGALRLWFGDHEKAIQAFRIASESRPSSAVLHTNLAAAYIASSRFDKALKSLKIAVAIDPLNRNAVNFLADVAHSTNRNEDAIPSLRLYLQFEQKNASIWDKLARALLRLDQHDEAIAALKRRASIEDSSDVWNNLGVCYYRKGDRSRALESFKHGIANSASRRDIGFCLSGKNAAYLLERSARPIDGATLVDSIATRENLDVFLSRRDLASIFVTKLQSLIRGKKLEEAREYGEQILQAPDTPPSLQAGILTALLALYSLHEATRHRALALAQQYSGFALTTKGFEGDLRLQLLNNIAFVFAEHDFLEDAERHLQPVSNWIHKNPYPTATSGLIHFKKGHTEKAEALYSEALHISMDPLDKARIRQKWNFEIGKSLVETDPRRAKRFFQKTIAEQQGEDGISASARARLLKLQVLP